MAGKTRRPGAKNPNWGGARPNSGPKPAYMLTENQIKKMLSTARKAAKEQGKTIDDVLVGIIYDDDTSTRDKLAAIKLFKDFTMVKTSEKNVNVKTNDGPNIGLPPRREDPALEVVEGGKK